MTYKQQGAKTYLNYIRNVIRFKCDWKKRLFSSSYTAFSEMVVTDRTESPLSGISNKNTFKRKQVFYDLVDEYWNEDFWRNYNIIDLRNPWRMQSANCGNNPIDYLIVFLIFGATEKKHRVCWTN